jgi:hypothetical protein
LSSSNRIELLEIISDDSALEELWGGLFYHPGFIAPAAKLLNLSGKAQYILFNSRCVGALNLLQHSKLGIRTATTPLLFQYFGPVLFDPSNWSDLHDDIDKHLRSLCDFAYFSYPPGLFDKTGFGSWQIENTFTQAVHAADLKCWGNNFKDDVKNKIRKAKRDKVIVSRADKLPVELWQTTFARRNINPPIKMEALESWSNYLISKSLLNIYIAQIDDTAVAFRGELVYGRYAYDWIAGSDPAFHSTGANQLLMAEIGNELSGHNLTAWDLVGGEIRSIVDFKKSFGAREIPHTHAQKCFNFKGRIFKYLRKIRHGW